MVLAAVAVGGSPEVSSTCSRLLSVSASFEGVMFSIGSEGIIPGVSGKLSSTTEGSKVGAGGGRPGSLESSASVGL